MRAARRGRGGARLFPSLGVDDLALVLYEPEAGVLRAQRAVQTLAAQAVAHGARLVRGRATPDGDAALVADGERLEGDAVVWAAAAGWASCSPGSSQLSVTRQELFFFDGGPAWRRPACPAGSTTTARSTAPATSTSSA